MATGRLPDVEYSVENARAHGQRADVIGFFNCMDGQDWQDDGLGWVSDRETWGWMRLWVSGFLLPQE